MIKTEAKKYMAEMGLFEHLAELRRRLIVAFFAIFTASCIAYVYSLEVFEFLSQPFYAAFTQQSLIGTGPAEAFLLRLKVALFCGIVLAAPVIFYQIWLFVVPGLYEHERKLLVPFLFFSSLLFLLGLTFCYYLVLPLAFQFFFEQYEKIALTPTIRLSEHLSMVLTSLLSFGAVFEMPMLAYFLGRMGVIDSQFLIGSTRYALVIIFIVAAILTPPDIISQFLMAAPLMLLFGLSILVVRATERSSEQDKEKESQ